MKKRIFITALTVSLLLFGFYACSTSRPKTKTNKALAEILKTLADSAAYVEMIKMPELLNKRSFYRSVEYPKRCRKAGAEGTVYVSFTVTKTGDTKNFKVIQGIGFGCARAAIRSIKNYAEFSPAMKNGEPVSVRYALPVTYHLK